MQPTHYIGKEFNSRHYLPETERRFREDVRVNKVLNLIGQGKKILDIGCGDGSIATLIQKSGNEVEGVELSVPAFKAAKKRGIKVYLKNLEEDWTRPLSKKYDLVFAGEVIEHVYDTDVFLERIKKILVPAGGLLITTPNIASLGRRLYLLLGCNPLLEASLAEPNAGHVRYFTFDSLKKLLIRHGFKIQVETSTVVNFDVNGTIRSARFATILPTLGSTIIVKAIKASGNKS